MITPDTRIVRSPDRKGVILVGVGNENGETTPNLMEWNKDPNDDALWYGNIMNQTLNVARKGAMVVPISDEWTSCSN